MRDERGDVDGRRVRRVKKGQGERQEELEEHEQVSEQEGALTWRSHGDGKHCNDTKETTYKYISDCMNSYMFVKITTGETFLNTPSNPHKSGLFTVDC